MVLPQLLETENFLHSKMHTLNGPAIANKGRALFGGAHFKPRSAVNFARHRGALRAFRKNHGTAIAIVNFAATIFV